MCIALQLILSVVHSFLSVFDDLLWSIVSTPKLLDLPLTRTVHVSQSLDLLLQPRHHHFFAVAVPSF